MRESIGHGDPRPAGVKALVFPVLIVPPQRPLEAVIVSDTWLGLCCHWWRAPGDPEPRTTICTAPAQCVCLSEPDVPFKWHCYILVVTMHNLRHGVLSLTDPTLHELVGIDADAVSFRGSVLIFKRASEHKSSKVLVEQSPKRWLRPLPDRLSLRPTLEAVYGKAQIAAWSALHPDEDFTP